MTRILLGIDPGASAAYAFVKDGPALELLSYGTHKTVDMKNSWLQSATSLASTLNTAIQAITATYGTMPYIGVEQPVLGPSAWSYGSQMAFFGALEASLLHKGWTVTMRVHPLQSKKALTGLGRAPKNLDGSRVSEKVKKEAMIHACKLRGLWPDNEPTTADARMAVADAIAHAVALANFLRTADAHGLAKRA